MRIGSLFSGYGGADLAVRSVWPDATPAWFVEFDQHPSTILAKRFPGVKNFGDVTTINWEDVDQAALPIDILTAGYPCQPFSHAGQRRGTNDERHLFPYVADAIGVLRPRYVFLENVAGHLTLGGPEVIGTLTGLGYSVRWGVVRASDAGAPHRRARLFIIATDRDTNGAVIGYGAQRRAGVRPDIGQSSKPGGVGRATADTARERIDGTGATGPGRWSEPTNGSGATADADGAGLEGRGVLPQRRHQRAAGAGSVGAPPDTVRDGGGTPADTSGERHGAGQNAGAVGRVDGEDAGQSQQRQRAREVTGDRSAAAVTDAEGHEQRQPAEPGQVRTQPGHGPVTGSVRVDFGPYAAAVARWERILGRPAPAPTEPGRDNRPRLNPAFVEWMMGLPEGWVTATDIPRSAQLKALGNGIVPQQAALAIRLLMGMDA